MVMTGTQAKDVILGENGLCATMPKNGAVILSATVKPQEAREIGAAMEGSGIHLIDTPVSGGFPGAQNGTLTMMAAAPGAVLDEFAPVMEAVSANIHRVGTRPGDGQTVKACLQSLIGAQFSATFEAAALAAKAGVPGQVILDVFSTSSAGCGVVNNALQKIIDRQFKGTGSHINTMHKDLTISMNLGEELGVPLHTAAAAMQIFHAGRTKYPDGDNWVCTRVIEEIIGAELHREGAQ
jgi:3-hydroxyisobutyrate dehydrogenase/putative dehydrogenase